MVAASRDSSLGAHGKLLMQLHKPVSSQPPLPVGYEVSRCITPFSTHHLFPRRLKPTCLPLSPVATELGERQRRKSTGAPELAGQCFYAAVCPSQCSLLWHTGVLAGLGSENLSWDVCLVLQTTAHSPSPRWLQCIQSCPSLLSISS